MAWCCLQGRTRCDMDGSRWGLGLGLQQNQELQLKSWVFPGGGFATHFGVQGEQCILAAAARKRRQI